MQIVIETKHQYGNPRNWPVCKKAHTFAKIAGQKTLTDERLGWIMELGVEIVQKTEWYQPAKESDEMPPVDSYEGF